MGDSPSCATHKALAAAGQSLGEALRAHAKLSQQCWPRVIKSEPFLVWISFVWRGHLIQKPSDLHSGNQGWNSVHTVGTGLGEPPLGAQEWHTAELSRSRGGDANLGQQSLSRNFPGPVVLPGWGEEGPGGSKEMLVRPSSYPGASTLWQGLARGEETARECTSSELLEGRTTMTELKLPSSNTSAHQISVSWGSCEVTDLPGFPPAGRSGSRMLTFQEETVVDAHN